MYRAAVVYEQVEEELSWLVGSDQRLLNLFTWQDEVNAEVGVGKERTSLVSTSSLAELHRFAMNFLLMRKRKR